AMHQEHARTLVPDCVIVGEIAAQGCVALLVVDPLDLDLGAGRGRAERDRQREAGSDEPWRVHAFFSREFATGASPPAAFSSRRVRRRTGSAKIRRVACSLISQYEIDFWRRYPRMRPS